MSQSQAFHYFLHIGIQSVPRDIGLGFAGDGTVQPSWLLLNEGAGHQGYHRRVFKTGKTLYKINININ